MLAGRHPFKADDARGLLMMQATKPVPPLTDPRPDLATVPALVAAVAKACAKDPLARQQSAGALRDELARAIGPAFMMPPGATPAPSVSVVSLTSLEAVELPPSPLPINTLRPAPPLPGYEPKPPPLHHRAGAALRAAARATGAHARANRTPWAIAAAVLVLLAVAIALFARSNARDAKQARAFLAGNRPAEARVVLDRALEGRPEDPELLLLRGHALHELSGRAADGIEAYAAARTHGALLDGKALENLVADLGRERSVADRAAKVLRDEADRAVPAVLGAVDGASGAHRLRVLTLARDLGAEDRLDRVAAYALLLADPECETRRAAARRLGEIGDPAALPALRKAGQGRTEVKGVGLFAKTRLVPSCGAPDAEAAAKRIEAARLPTP
jgi:serine/threonine-protein kinase